MFPYLAALKALPWRLIGYCAAALAAVLLFWRVSVWREGYLERDAAIASEKAAIERSGRALAELQRKFDAAQKASKEYQDDLSKIRADRAARRDLPARSVRLCQQSPTVQRPADTGGPDAAATAAAQPSEAAGPDIGPSLYDLADDGDEREAELAAQIRRLQEALIAQGVGQ